MDTFYAKEDLALGIDEGIPFFIDLWLKEDVHEERLLSINGRKYKVMVHRLGKKADGKVWTRIICKGAKYNHEHPEEQVATIIEDTLPALLKQGQESKKTIPFQIRFTPSQREKISLLAKKEGVSISDFIIQKVLA